MKKLLAACFLLSGLFMTLVSCSDDSNSAPPPGTSDVPQSILAQFSEDYPDARDATWSLTQDGYYTVEFSTSESARNTSWYDKQGRRDMAQHEIFFDQLPDAVRDGFAATEYGQTGSEWRADREVDVLKRRGSGNGNGETGETLYIIEVEGPDGTEVDLYFTADGILVQEVVDAGADKNYGQYLPQAPAADMKDWLDTHFPGYRLIDIEGEDGGLEVEFVFDRRKYEAFFGPGNQWLYYKTELHYGSSLIPDVVKATVEASELMQQGARVDEVEMYVVNDGGTEVAYFCFELETRFDDDRKMYVRADGTEERPQLGGSGSQGGMPVETDVEAFLNERYPGAVVVERDHDDGFLEITIRHEGVLKEVRFNGRHEWVRTEWETRSLPDAVRQGIEAEGYRISDNEFERIEKPDGSWYEVEAVKDRREWQLHVADDGTILAAHRDD